MPASTPNIAAFPTRRLTYPRLRNERDLVDVRPAPVALEDHLARLASKHDLELPPTDGGGVPTAYRTRRRLVLEGTRKGVHFYL
jgi:hypothetical protein